MTIGSSPKISIFLYSWLNWNQLNILKEVIWLANVHSTRFSLCNCFNNPKVFFTGSPHFLLFFTGLTHLPFDANQFYNFKETNQATVTMQGRWKMVCSCTFNICLFQSKDLSFGPKKLYVYYYRHTRCPMYKGFNRPC